MTDRHWWLGWLALAVVTTTLAGLLPGADDEYYYWCWSQELSPSYYDHPPVTAWMIRASTEIFGHSLLAIRLPAVCASLLVLCILRRLTYPRSFSLWMLPLPLSVFGAILITPDSPLLLCWSCYLWWLGAVQERLDRSSVPVAWWLLGGAILGFGLLSKYTMGLAVPAGFVSFLFVRRGLRVWWLGYLLHGLVASLAMVPILVFNLDYDFVPLQFQWQHAMTRESEGFLGFAEFLGSQVLLFGWLPLLLLPWVRLHTRELLAVPRLRAAVCLYALPLVFFLWKASHTPLEGNWALVSYLGFWPIAAHWSRRTGSFALPALGFSLPILAVCGVLLSLLIPMPVLDARHDPIAKAAARDRLVAVVAEAIRAEDATLPVYAISYQWTARLRYEGIPANQLTGATRPSHFTLQPHYLNDGKEAFVFAEGPLCPEFTPGYGPPTVIRTFPLTVRGRTIGEYQLLRYTRQ